MGPRPPDLDDRTFQGLVDDAKRLVQRRCPEWTDHNVSDPGVTLIETFAFMVDQLLYRLNRVPDRLYVTFLDLIGVRLHPPTAAVAPLTFWLSAAPQPEPVEVPEGTEVSTLRTSEEDAVVFATARPLVVPPRELAQVATQRAGFSAAAVRDPSRAGQGFLCFSQPPAVGDALLLGLDDAAPSCAVVLRFVCDVEGVGVDPKRPPLRWEAWTGADWVLCDVDDDGTGGLNRPGDIVLHLPPDHAASEEAGQVAGWLRCRVVEPDRGARSYSHSPTVRSVTAFTSGGTVPGVHAETVRDEVLGLSEGVPGQVFPLARRPVAAGGPPFVVQVAAGAGWATWKEVATFAECGPDAQVFRVDRAHGEVEFGPAVRAEDGSLVRHGAVPPKGSPLRIPVYRTGGGPSGNVAAGGVRVLRTTVPLVSRVENRRPAVGGVAGETVDEARLRGPLTLRTRGRAVTAEDYEQLARGAAPEIARVRCVPAPADLEPGGVRVLVVPAAAPDGRGRLRFQDLVPPDASLRAVAAELDEHRCLGARVLVEPPHYQGVTVKAWVTARPGVSADLLREEALEALHRYFDPLHGGPDGDGWPFGRPVQSGEAYAVLQRLPGTDMVDGVELQEANPLTGERGEAVQRIDLDPHALVFSYAHEVSASEAS